MAMREIRALVEQVNALKELVMQRIVREKLPRRSEATMRQEVPAKTTNSNRVEEKGDRRGRGLPVKSTERHPTINVREGEGTLPTGEAERDTWARVVGRKEKEANRKMKRQNAHFNNNNKACNQVQQAQGRGRTKQKGTTRETG